MSQKIRTHLEFWLRKGISITNKTKDWALVHERELLVIGIRSLYMDENHGYRIMI